MKSSIPYFAFLIIFVLAFLLIFPPTWEYFSAHCSNEYWASFVVALLLGITAFILSATIILDRDCHYIYRC